MKKLLILMVLITTAMITASAQSERFGTRQWKLVELEGANVGSSTTAYLALNRQQTRFTGSTGCNQMFGSARVRGRRVDFSNIGTTKMACEKPRVRRVETAFVRALENVDRFRQIGNTLELYDRNRMTVKLMAFTKLPPERPDNGHVGLEDRKWILESIKGDRVGKLGETAFLNFDREKGSAGGNSSCNVFGGSYSATGSTLKITDVISTMRACIEDERMSIERQFLGGLRETNRYEIENGKLKLYRNRQLLLTFVGERK